MRLGEEVEGVIRAQTMDYTIVWALGEFFILIFIVHPMYGHHHTPHSPFRTTWQLCHHLDVTVPRHSAGLFAAAPTLSAPSDDDDDDDGTCFFTY